MSFLVADGHFLRGVMAGLAVATALSGAAAVFAVLAVPAPPAVMTVTFQSP